LPVHPEDRRNRRMRHWNRGDHHRSLPVPIVVTSASAPVETAFGENVVAYTVRQPVAVKELRILQQLARHTATLDEDN
ncbi:hypothetical protein WI664_08435, partial [Vibrio cholerae]